MPNRSISPEKVRMPVTETISNSSARDCEKCSHSALLSSTPEAASSDLTDGRQPPQVVPALVQP